MAGAVCFFWKILSEHFQFSIGISEAHLDHITSSMGSLENENKSEMSWWFVTITASPRVSRAVRLRTKQVLTQ